MDIILAFDSDAAGQAGMMRAAKTIMEFNRTLALPKSHPDYPPNPYEGNTDVEIRASMLLCGLWRTWHDSLPDCRARMLVFPAEHKQVLKRRLSVLKQELNRILMEERQIKNTTHDEFELWQLGETKKTYQKEFSQIQWLLTPANKQKIMNISKAKLFPITQLLTFNRSKNAICPWHDDKHASLHYYDKNNTVYCFSCGQSGDSIDVAMAVYGLNFKDAVDKLTN